MSDKREWTAAFKPSKRIREAIPAGTQFKPAATAIQFYGEVEREVKRRIEQAENEIEAYRSQDHGVYMEEDRLIIPLPRTMQDISREIIELAKYLKAYEELEGGREALERLKDLKSYEENAANKKGLDELRQMIVSHDWLAAASLTETND